MNNRGDDDDDDDDGGKATPSQRSPVRKVQRLNSVVTGTGTMAPVNWMNNNSNSMTYGSKSRGHI